MWKSGSLLVGTYLLLILGKLIIIEQKIAKKHFAIPNA